MKFYMKEGEDIKFWQKWWTYNSRDETKDFEGENVSIVYWKDHDKWSMWDIKHPTTSYHELFITYTEMCYIKLCNGKGVEIVPTS